MASLVFPIAGLQKHTNTNCCLAFLVSGRLFGISWEGQEFPNKTNKTYINNCFLYVSEEFMLRNIQKTIVVLDFLVADLQKHTQKTIVFLFFLVSGRLFGSKWEGQDFTKTCKKNENNCFCVLLKISDQKNLGNHCFCMIR